MKTLLSIESSKFGQYTSPHGNSSEQIVRETFRNLLQKQSTENEILNFFRHLVQCRVHRRERKNTAKNLSNSPFSPVGWKVTWVFARTQASERHVDDCRVACKLMVEDCNTIRGILLNQEIVNLQKLIDAQKSWIKLGGKILFNTKRPQKFWKERNCG